MRASDWGGVDPLYIEEITLGHDEICQMIGDNDNPTETENIPHEAERVSMSSVAFLKFPDRSVVDSTRKSQRKTKLFLKFLLQLMVK